MNQLIRLLIFVSIGTLAVACSDPDNAAAAAKPDPFAHLTPEEQEIFQQGQARAHSCAACHGPMGISRNRMYPSIAGLPEAELKQALLDYRTGERKNPLMSPQARGLSDDDIELLAAFFTLLSSE